MNRRRFLLASLGVGLGPGLIAGCRRPTDSANREMSPNLFNYSRKNFALGTTVSIQLFAFHKTQADTAFSESFAALESVERQMSLYRDDSAICMLNKDGVLAKPDREFLAVLQTAKLLFKNSNGAFDVTVQPLWNLFAEKSNEGLLPTAKEITDIRKRVSGNSLRISSKEIRLKLPQSEITLNGLAQGYAVDQVVKVVKKHGIQNALIETGEVGALGQKGEGGVPWKLGVQHPRKQDETVSEFSLKDSFLATSGDYETAFTKDFRHNHIFDPRTGISPTRFSSVSVTAPTAMLADGLSTALFVMSLEEGKELLKQYPGAGALYVRKAGEVIKTDGFGV